jgi:hypothetical protein
MPSRVQRMSRWKSVSGRPPIVQPNQPPVPSGCSKARGTASLADEPQGRCDARDDRQAHSPSGLSSASLASAGLSGAAGGATTGASGSRRQRRGARRRFGASFCSAVISRAGSRRAGGGCLLRGEALRRRRRWRAGRGRRGRRGGLGLVLLRPAHRLRQLPRALAGQIIDVADLAGPAVVVFLDRDHSDRHRFTPEKRPRSLAVPGADSGRCWISWPRRRSRRYR